MIDLIIAFVVMINPFALFLYLDPVRKDLDRRAYHHVLLKANFISYIIYLVFILTGQSLFNNVFQIHFESFRLFGGIVIFTIALQFIVGGRQAFIKMRGSLSDLASEIALPFVVGAGTISIALLMEYTLGKPKAVLAVLIALSINIFIVFGLGLIRKSIKKEKFKIAFDKNMGVLLRIMGFFSGAIGINMIVVAVKNLIQ